MKKRTRRRFKKFKVGTGIPPIGTLELIEFNQIQKQVFCVRRLVREEEQRVVESSITTNPISNSRLLRLRARLNQLLAYRHMAWSQAVGYPNPVVVCSPAKALAKAKYLKKHGKLPPKKRRR